jgi:hypothetical protein
VKENDVHFSSGALSKYAELQLRNYAGEESAGKFLKINAEPPKANEKMATNQIILN